jgi:hypothetical protein
MEVPKKYAGYNEDGEIVITRWGEDANNYINPRRIEECIEDAYNTRDYYISQIQKALKDVIGDANQSIVIENKQIGTEIEELIESLERLKGKSKFELEVLKNNSEEKHDEIQKAKNLRAWTICYNQEGVDYVNRIS